MSLSSSSAALTASSSSSSAHSTGAIMLVSAGRTVLSSKPQPRRSARREGLNAYSTMVNAKEGTLITCDIPTMQVRLSLSFLVRRTSVLLSVALDT